MWFSWDRASYSMVSLKLDWYSNFSQKNLSSFEFFSNSTDNITCETTRLAIGSQLESGSIFDIDDLQIFPKTLRDEILLTKMPGKLQNQFFIFLFCLLQTLFYIISNVLKSMKKICNRSQLIFIGSNSLHMF